MFECLGQAAEKEKQKEGGGGGDCPVEARQKGFAISEVGGKKQLLKELNIIGIIEKLCPIILRVSSQTMATTSFYVSWLTGVGKKICMGSEHLRFKL